MPPVFGPVSPSPTRLWSCAEASGIAVSPSHSAKNDASSPTRNSSITTSAPAAPRPPPNIMSMAASASASVSGDDDALAGREPIRLDHDRHALLADIGLRRLSRREPLIGRGRNVVGPAQVLGEALRALQPRRGFARAERLEAGRFEIVDHAGDQRRLRPDHDEVDLVRLAERDHRRVVGDVERDAFGLLRDAGIARRANEPVGQRAGGELPGQRVLAPAGAEEENVHAGASTSTGGRSRRNLAAHSVHSPASTRRRAAWFACAP